VHDLRGETAERGQPIEPSHLGVEPGEPPRGEGGRDGQGESPCGALERRQRAWPHPSDGVAGSTREQERDRTVGPRRERRCRREAVPLRELRQGARDALAAEVGDPLERLEGGQDVLRGGEAAGALEARGHHRRGPVASPPPDGHALAPRPIGEANHRLGEQGREIRVLHDGRIGMRPRGCGQGKGRRALRH
jgi:hypothetical protein